MITIEAFRRLGSCVAWLVLISMVLPSVVANAILYAACGAAAPAEVMEAWRSISKEPFPTSPVAHLVLQIGRGAFKSTMLFILAIDRLLRFDPRPFIAAGSEVTSVIVAPTMKQAAAIVRSNRALAEAVAALLGGKLIVRDMSNGAELVFDIPNLGYVARIVVGPADEATIRGIAPVFFGVTEAGWMPSAAKAANTLSDVRVGVVPRGRAQFPHFLECEESTNGPPAGYFFEVCENTPAGVLKIGPLSSGSVNPSIDDRKLRETLSPEEYSQEIECTSWGLKEAAFISATAAFACIDEEGTYTPKGIRRVPGMLGALDLRGASKDGDEYAYGFGYPLEVEIAPGRFVRHLVMEAIVFGRPKERMTFEDQGRPFFQIASELGCPTLADEIGKANVARVSREEFGFRDELDANEDERRAAIRRGGKVFVPRSMAAKAQTERWLKLRDLVISGRLHLPDTDGGREAARELAALRATTQSNRTLKVEAASGEQDGISDILSYLAEAFEWVEASRGNGEEDRFIVRGTHWDPQSGDPLVVDGEWRRFKNGVDVGRGEPPITHPSFPQHFAACIAGGSYSDRVVAFCKQRLGIEHEPAPADYRLVIAQLAKSNEIDSDHPVAAYGFDAGDNSIEARIALANLRGRGRI